MSEAWSRAAAGDREEGDGALSAEKEKRAALLPEVGGEPARFCCCCCWCTLPPGVAALEEVVVAGVVVVTVLVGAEVEVSIIVSANNWREERSWKERTF